MAKVIPIVEKKQIQKLEKAIKKRKDDEIEAEKQKPKPVVKKKVEEPPKQPTARLKSPTKLKEEKPKEEEKKEGKKKPVMRDACT